MVVCDFASARIAEQFGRDHLRGYVRAWRSDDAVRNLLRGPDSASDWFTRVTQE